MIAKANAVRTSGTPTTPPPPARLTVLPPQLRMETAAGAAPAAPAFALTPSDGGAVGDTRVHHLEDELEAARAEIAQLARHVEIDTLTGLLNHQGVERCLDLEVRRARRYERDLAVLLVDVHRLGAINDVKGRASGDEVLRTLADGIRDAIRVTDVLGRGRSGEYFVICPETDAAGAVKVAEKLTGRAARETFAVAGSPVPLSICIGVVPVSPGMTTGDVLHSAEVALARAKKAGGNRWSL